MTRTRTRLVGVVMSAMLAAPVAVLVAPAAHADGLVEACLGSHLTITKTAADTGKPLAGAKVKVSYVGAAPYVGVSASNGQPAFYAAMKAAWTQPDLTGLTVDQQMAAMAAESDRVLKAQWAATPQAKSVTVTTAADGTADVWAVGGTLGAPVPALFCRDVKLAISEVQAPAGYLINPATVTVTGSQFNNTSDDPNSTVDAARVDQLTTTIVDQPVPAMPTLTSQMLIATAGSRTTLSDEVTVAGASALLKAAPSATLAYTGQLLGPVLPATPGSCQGLDWAAAATVTKIGPIKVTGDTVISDLGETSPAPGCYTYAGQLTVIIDGVTHVVEHAAGQVTQTGPVVPAVAVASQVSATEVTVGASLSDAVTVTDMGALLRMDPAAKVSFAGRLMGPVAPDASGTCAGVSWVGAATAAMIPATPVPASGHLTGLGVFTPTTPGCYSYEGVLSVLGGQGPSYDGEHVVGQASETVLVKAAPAGGDGTTDGGDGITVDAGVPDDPGFPAASLVSVVSLGLLLIAAFMVATRRGRPAHN